MNALSHWFSAVFDMKGASNNPATPLPISSVDHVSLLCSSVETSSKFYERVLGFVPIKRPGSLSCDGAWLFNNDFGIHLLESSQVSVQLPKKKDIDPKDYHMSFQSACQNVDEVEERLKKLAVHYKRVQVEENGILVDQIFFHDPDGFMIEVCTCDNLPVVPLKSTLSYRHQNETNLVCSKKNARGPTATGAIRSNSVTEVQETVDTTQM